MATKTITIMEDAYKLMAMEKMPNESFSDLVRRKFRNADLLQFAGAWKDMSDEQAEELKASVRAVRENMNKGFARKIKKLQARMHDMP